MRVARSLLPVFGLNWLHQAGSLSSVACAAVGHPSVALRVCELGARTCLKRVSVSFSLHGVVQ